MQKFNQANIVLGGGNASGFVFKMLRETFGFETKANPDFLFLESQSFSIDDARGLEKWALGKSIGGPVKVSYIATKSITLEAQNALLKLFEEPSEGTYIFLHLESLGNILPTFLSRIRVLNFEPASSKKNASESKADNFFNSSLKDRFAMINTMAKSEDKSDIKELIKDLEKIAYGRGAENAKDAEAMKNVLKAKIFTTARGSSPKMLLEWLACVLQ